MPLKSTGTRTSLVLHVHEFVPVAAHAPISANPSNFEIISHKIIKIINHIPISISQEGLAMYLRGIDPCKKF